MRLRADARMHSANSRIQADPTDCTQGCPSIPSGLRTPPRCGNGPGSRVRNTLVSKIAAPERKARGRHLREGNLPSGKSITINVPSSPRGRAHDHSVNASNITGPGAEPVLARL